MDFDVVYRDLIKPAVEEADLEPLRADEEQAGGIIHKAMFERLILCEFAVADLTTANANVFYELGVRHAVRPWATQLLYAEGWGQLPFDVNLLRALPYRLRSEGTPADAPADSTALAARLRGSRDAKPDSPLYQLVEDFPDVKRLKTDVFRDRVRYAESVKARLALARRADIAAVTAVEHELGDLQDAEAAVVVDLFLSYRAVQAWKSMIDLVDRMAPPLAAAVMIQEQLGLALNRAGRGQEAEGVLLDLLARRGASSETYGVLGRVYKDRWQHAARTGRETLARGLLDKAIATYMKGFEADWRDAYPGINAVTLMEMKEPPDPRQVELLPVVTYSVNRRVAQGHPDYWDYATLLELAVLGRNEDRATKALGDALAHVREPWELETTARNLSLIRETRMRRGEDVKWIAGLEDSLKPGTG